MYENELSTKVENNIPAVIVTKQNHLNVFIKTHGACKNIIFHTFHYTGWHVLNRIPNEFSETEVSERLGLFECLY